MYNSGTKFSLLDLLGKLDVSNYYLWAQPIRGTKTPFFGGWFCFGFGFFFNIQFTSTMSPGWLEGGWTRPDLAAFAPCAPEPTGKICAVGCCCWDWVGGAGSQQAALGGCSLALIKLGRTWKAKDSQHAGQRHWGQRATCSGSRMSLLPWPGAPRDDSVKGWLWHWLFHSTGGEGPGARLCSAQMPHPCPCTSSPGDLLGCKALTDHCRLQSLSASKWPFPYLENLVELHA